jgi:hypothetical protein
VSFAKLYEAVEKRISMGTGIEFDILFTHFCGHT